VIELELDDLLHIAHRVLDEAQVRDVGLLEAAVARPRTSVGGVDAYPTLHLKAAALVHSVVRNHALVDGNKRLGLGAVLVFYRVNGRRLTMSEDEAHDFIVAIASGELDDVGQIAEILKSRTRPVRRR